MKPIDINCISYSITADLYANNSDKVILVLPGWTSNKASYRPMVSFIVERVKCSALVIDYSGHGESPYDAMEIRPAQHFLEVITAFDWIKDNYPDAQIIVMGASYGGYMAATLTEYRDFEKLVLRAPSILSPLSFYNLNKNIDRKQERLYRKDQVFIDNHPLFTKLSIFKGKTLVVWHELDENVPKETTNKYIEYFKADNYLAKGWMHSYKTDADEKEQQAYTKTIADWLINTSSETLP